MKSEKISEELIRNLLHAMPCWHSKLVRPFKDSLSGEMSLETYYCLETLKSCGTVTMTELARKMKVPKQQITRLIDTLTGHQFVERVHDEEDRRMIKLRLTPRAVSYIESYYSKNKRFIRSLEEQLTKEELYRLNDALVVLSETLSRLS